MFAGVAQYCPKSGYSAVGYQNIGFNDTGWMMTVGVQFSNMQTADGSFDVGEQAFSKVAVEGDQMIAFDGNQWNIHQWDKQAEGEGWVLTPSDGGDQEAVASVNIKKGGLVYYVPAGDTELPVSGQVAPLGEQSVTFDMDGGDWIFPIANPFPVDTKWGDLNTFTAEGDQLIAFDGNQWNINQWDKQAEGEGWVLTPSDGSEQQLINDEDEVILPAGTGAYIVPTETKTWTVTIGK